MKNEEILPLTSLRFFAAFYLFVFHLHTRWPITSNLFCCNIFSAGAIGMSLFFMLSGFVLTYRYQNTDFSYKEYSVNRFARIYPIYALVALLTTPWFGIDIINTTGKIFIKSVIQSFILIISNIFLIQSWFPQFANYWNDGGSWSISTEAFFYALFPFILRLFSDLKYKTILLVAIGFYIISIMPGVIHTIFDHKMTPWVYYSIPIFRLPEFIIGMCLCLLMKDKKYNTNFLLIPAFALFFLYLGSGKFSFVHLGTGHNWLVIPIVAIILVSIRNSKGVFAKILSWKPLVWAGKISYCFFSFQFVVILPFMSYREEIVKLIPILGYNKVYFIFSFFLLLGVSAIGHHLIEQPMHRWIKNRWSRNLKSVVY